MATTRDTRIVGRDSTGHPIQAKDRVKVIYDALLIRGTVMNWSAERDSNGDVIEGQGWLNISIRPDEDEPFIRIKRRPNVVTVVR